MGEHGNWQKQTQFENATRIPLIISAPNLENKGVISNSPVELIDLYPTLMDLSHFNDEPKTLHRLQKNDTVNASPVSPVSSDGKLLY